jgi:hypothetical protein
MYMSVVSWPNTETIVVWPPLRSTGRAPCGLRGCFGDYIASADGTRLIREARTSVVENGYHLKSHVGFQQSTQYGSAELSAIENYEGDTP